MKSNSFSYFVTPGTVACQAFPNRGVKPGSPALQVDSLLSETPGRQSSRANREQTTVIKSFSNKLPPWAFVSQFRSVQFSLSVVPDLFATPWTAACQASLSITNSRSLLKFITIELMMPSNYLILCRPLLLLP